MNRFGPVQFFQEHGIGGTLLTGNLIRAGLYGIGGFPGCGEGAVDGNGDFAG